MAVGPLACLALAGCSSILDALPDGGEKAPKAAVMSVDLKKVGEETKLPQPWQIAGPIEADPVTVTPWIVCLRSNAPDQARQTYALFYKGGKLQSYRFAAIVDRCDQQSFRSF
ncbi:MAG: hypothetical protein QM576_00940 [Rhodopseudomonas sp.]|uniref:hypothetical protein n=1 Tax=Rhodopseudomonas sp. TaxID=1078 RepID=UPI001E2E8474|nr:hypothetical protein [Rubrivivax sp. JA1024]